MQGIQNGIAFITGGEQGLGKGIATRFAKEGATVVVFGINEEKGLETEAELKVISPDSMFIKGNVLNSEELTEAMDTIKKVYGKLDFAINCAGTGNGMVATHELSIEDYDFVMNLNVKGVLLSMQSEIKVMLDQNVGKIVNISSSLGLVGMKGLAAYTASKHAVIGLTKVAALDYADTGIRVNAVAPGTMMTPLVATFPEEVVSSLKAAHPINDLISIDHAAANVVFLCSSDSDQTTGATIAVDGALTAQ